ncbi:MAG: hypothetical protein KY397_01940 [Gemmatimonadetes bacterium]|nr:hypothetical protein [Gemmatimonadota bacterium]
MIHSAYRALLVAHVVFGFVGLVAFWIPVFAAKGGRLHVRTGTAFLWSAYVVAATAIAICALSLIRPFGTHPEAMPVGAADVGAVAGRIRELAVFLGYLGIVTLASVHHGVGAMRAGRRVDLLRTPFHTAVHALSFAAGLGVLALGVVDREILFVALSPIGLVGGWSGLRYARRRPSERMPHWYQHIGGMLGGGIAFHTAFAVFGASRLFDYSLEGTWAIVPWILPSVIGIPAIALWQRHYRAKYEADAEAVFS